MGRRPKWTFLKEDIQMAKRHMKKMFSIADYRRNANQKHNEVLAHTWKNSHHLKKEKVCKWWKWKLVQSLRRTVWRFLIKLKIVRLSWKSSG